MTEAPSRYAGTTKRHLAGRLRGFLGKPDRGVATTRFRQSHWSDAIVNSRWRIDISTVSKQKLDCVAVIKAHGTMQRCPVAQSTLLHVSTSRKQQAHDVEPSSRKVESAAISEGKPDLRIIRIAAEIEQRLNEMERTPVYRIPEREFSQAEMGGVQAVRESAG